MKTKLVLIVLSGLWLVLLCLSHEAKAQYQPPDSCLKLIWPVDYYDPISKVLYYNPDSIKIDVCNDLPTYGKQFATRYFMLQFQPYYYPFDKILKPDSIQEVSDISSNRNELKLKFQQLESLFGKIYFQGLIREYPDSSVLANPTVRLFFENYQEYLYIEEYFKNFIDSIKDVIYAYRAKLIDDVNETLYKNDVINIYPIPTSDYLYIHNHNYNYNNKIIISSVTGEVLLTVEGNNEEEQKINIQSLSPGIYFLRIGNVCRKIIVNR